MKKLLLILFYFPLLFSCGDVDNLQREITKEMRDDGYSGKGTAIASNGNKYVGEWKNGNMHVHGTFSFTNGDKYVGEYKNGKMNGQGTKTYADGNKYVGNFKDDKQNGQGTYTFQNPWEQYVGEWMNDKKKGKDHILGLMGLSM